MSVARSLKPIRVEATGETVMIAGSFVPAGTGTTAPTGVRGTGFTVTQSASGVFVVQFQYPYVQRISFVCTAQVAGETTDVYAQAGDIVAASATAGEAVGIRTMTGSTPTNISGDSDALVSFIAIYRKR